MHKNFSMANDQNTCTHQVAKIKRANVSKLLENFLIYSMLVHVTFHNWKQEIKYVGSNCLLAFHEPLKSFQNQVIVFLALLSARGLGMKLLFLFGLSCFQSVKNDTNDTFDAQRDLSLSIVYTYSGDSNHLDLSYGRKHWLLRHSSF